jgi:hypothetical protein
MNKIVEDIDGSKTMCVPEWDGSINCYYFTPPIRPADLSDDVAATSTVTDDTGSTVTTTTTISVIDPDRNWGAGVQPCGMTFLMREALRDYTELV